MADERTAVDTNVLIAAFMTWHEHHEPSAAAWREVVAGAAAPILPLPVLIEAYSVLTRLPPPHRLSPADARRLLAANCRERWTTVSLDGTEAWQLLDDLVSKGHAGGVTHDAHIVACARKAGARRMLSFNRRHMHRLADGTLRIVDPREP